MNRLFFKSLCVFMLVAFALPGVVKSLHDLEHAHDSHCTATASDKHIHEAFHDCSLCDTQLSSTSELPAEFFVVITKTVLHYIAFFESNTLTTTSFLFSGRAPPAF